MSDHDQGNQSRLGSYIRCSVAGEAYQAFLPPALPPLPPVNLLGLQGLLSKANQALGKLDAVADILPDSNLLLYYYVRKEAVLSSQIEGTQSSLSDLLLHESGEDTISRSIASAKVDMNPHQVEAALFALRSPLSQGVILADEVGLGKTIEASLVIAQKWAERQRRILLIVPAMLRNQWAQELSEKFSMPTTIIETSSYNAAKKAGKLNPFESDRIVICSYEFAARKDVDVKNIDWHLVIFDEAHKLRNVWKKDGAKKAKALQAALDGKKKMLLSATPLQNSLLELYGLISIIDPHFFGSADAFKAQYVGGKATAQNLDILKHRLGKVCSRTLRRQVQQEGGIKFTRRHSIVEDFRPSQEELDLYDSISSYLQRDDIASIKPGARHLVTLVIRKILASSSFAISGTLEKMIQRLESGLTDINTETLDDIENIKDIAEDLDFEDEDDGERPDSRGSRRLGFRSSISGGRSTYGHTWPHDGAVARRSLHPNYPVRSSANSFRL